MKPSDLLPDSGEKRQFRKRVADPQPHEPVKGPGIIHPQRSQIFIFLWWKIPALAYRFA